MVLLPTQSYQTKQGVTWISDMKAEELIHFKAKIYQCWCNLRLSVCTHVIHVARFTRESLHEHTHWGKFEPA